MSAFREALPVYLSGAASVTAEGVSRLPLAIEAGHLSASTSRHAYRVDLRDHLVFPGLINAHDHLHVNAVPPLHEGAPFPNSYAWIDAFQKHFREPDVVAALQRPKALRMRHGALKNLLAGVTYVAHHDPWHPIFEATDFPVTVVRHYGWSYALGWPHYGPPVQQSFHDTPADWPWLIHLAEGTDEVAQRELDQLDRMGCLAHNTVLVHGVGMSEQDMQRVIASGAAVVWCPGSNRSLLGRTLDPRHLCVAGHLAMGSDSRLSGTRDLLDELREEACQALSSAQLLALVTVQAARILRLPQYGQVAPGMAADLVIVEDRGGDAASSLIGLRRSELRAVIRHGVPWIADADFVEWFAMAGVKAVPVMLDGKLKWLAESLADAALLALEPGLALVQAGRNTGARNC